MMAPAIYDRAGTARFLGRSATWVVEAFKSGALPTELLLNGVRPAITAPTLKKIARTLRDKRKMN
jgi:hypothetical protein